ncbi:MAG: hypothetical protein K6U09_04945 [Acidobacteriia bacterium]|jgi:hypothetical protein|nr:hypothetical protein [Terriglobia bacterium]
MTWELFLALVFVGCAWAVAVYLVRRFGAGYGARSVICPERQQRATISTVWMVRQPGRRAECSVLQCSLLPPGVPVNCTMACRAQL